MHTRTVAMANVLSWVTNCSFIYHIHRIEALVAISCFRAWGKGLAEKDVTSPLKRTQISKTLKNLITWRKIKNWRNVGRSVWRSKKTKLRNKMFFCKTTDYSRMRAYWMISFQNTERAKRFLKEFYVDSLPFRGIVFDWRLVVQLFLLVQSRKKRWFSLTKFGNIIIIKILKISNFCSTQLLPLKLQSFADVIVEWKW